MTTSQFRREVRLIIEREGATLMSLEYRGKHQLATYTCRGKTHRMVVAVSPSDHRVFHQVRSFVRRSLREAA
jgi:hypothetical protein